MDSGPHLVFILLCMNTFFVVTKIALNRYDRECIEELIANKKKGIRRLERLIDDPERGIRIARLGTLATGLVLVVKLWLALEGYISSYTAVYGDWVATLVTLVVLVYLVLLQEVLLSRYISKDNACKVVLKVGELISIIANILKPVLKSIELLERIDQSTSVTTSLEEKQSLLEEDIKEMITKGEALGVINETAKEMLYGVFKFGDKVATEIMIPRVDAVLVNIDDSLEKQLDKITHSKFSRIPVYKKTTHNIIGILPVKDFFEEALNVGIENIVLEKLLKPAYFVPETKAIETLFKELQYTKNNMAILIDEYGDFSGIVTMQDIVEEVTGDLVDDYNDDTQEISRIDEYTYLVDGLTHIEDVNKYFKLNIQCENFDTIGGFVVNLIGNIPRDSEKCSVEYQGVVFEVQQVKSNRVDKLKLYMATHLAVS